MTDLAPASPTEDAVGIGLSEAALLRIADAIATAEAKTSAEIRVVVAQAPLVQHPFFSVLWASLAALVLPWLVVLVRPMPSLTTLTVQAVLFVVIAAVLMLPSVAPRVVPRLALKAAARSAAIETFLAYGIPQTAGRTGILIYAAARERLVEVVADEGVHTPLGHGAWQEICGAVASRARQGSLADGLVCGVEKAGELLSGALPRGPDDRNELSNHVIVL
ncbi:TPM domain-containing protein [Xanthobacter autotrophicus]|uniref:TPM domain-containing protein n=1 Tax=Xanthobacter autotrophicus TaxID=280 RepID=UPI0037266DEB